MLTPFALRLQFWEQSLQSFPSQVHFPAVLTSILSSYMQVAPDSAWELARHLVTSLSLELPTAAADQLLSQLERDELRHLSTAQAVQLLVTHAQRSLRAASCDKALLARLLQVAASAAPAELPALLQEVEVRRSAPQRRAVALTARAVALWRPQEVQKDALHGTDLSALLEQLLQRGDRASIAAAVLVNDIASDTDAPVRPDQHLRLVQRCIQHDLLSEAALRIVNSPHVARNLGVDCFIDVVRGLIACNDTVLAADVLRRMIETELPVTAALLNELLGAVSHANASGESLHRCAFVSSLCLTHRHRSQLRQRVVSSPSTRQQQTRWCVCYASLSLVTSR